jgi:type I restriction enzyme S subunit
MSHWKEYKLSEVGKLQRGKSKHRPRYAAQLYGGPYPFIQTGQIREASKYITKYEQTYSEEGLSQSKLWSKGTLCITIAANIAEIAILSFDSCFPDSVIGFIPDTKKCDLDYAFYTLKYFQKELQQMGDGSAQDNINLGTFDEIKFPFPPLIEQIAIASILSSLDDKINLLQKQNKTLEQLAEIIFKQWFFEQANESWEEINFGAIIHQVKDRIKNSSVKAEDIKVLSAVKTGELVLSEDYFTKQVFSKDIGKYIVVKQFDFAYNPSRINIGSIGMLGENITGAVSPVYVVLRPKMNWHYYLQFMLKQQYVKSTIEIYASGSVRQSLDYDSFSKIEIKLPPFEKVEMFNKYYCDSLTKINGNKTQIKTLTHLRDTLLPKLMNGEVRVEN